MQLLLRKYNLSTLTVTGHADTVGAEANNQRLGQDRADAATAALVKLGVPEAMITSASKGEGAPQAVKTRDEVASARNRRVEIHFSPRASHVTLLPGELKPPDPKPTFDPMPKPPFDPFKKVPPKYEEPDPTKLPPDIFKPIPPARVKPKSALDTIAEKVLDPVIDAVAGGLSKSIRDKIKEGARDAVKSGVAKGARAAAEAAGLKDPQGLEAIEKAAEAAIQEKGRTEQ